jgi:hypothetical protein
MTTTARLACGSSSPGHELAAARAAYAEHLELPGQMRYHQRRATAAADRGHISGRSRSRTNQEVCVDHSSLISQHVSVLISGNITILLSVWGGVLPFRCRQDSS